MSNPGHTEFSRFPIQIVPIIVVLFPSSFTFRTLMHGQDGLVKRERERERERDRETERDRERDRERDKERLTKFDYVFMPLPFSWYNIA